MDHSAKAKKITGSAFDDFKKSLENAGLIWVFPKIMVPQNNQL